jgi:hypothetical protein
MLCKVAKASPSAVVFSSSLLIVIIAINCYRQIIHPHKKQLSSNLMKYVTVCVVIIASMFTAPQFYYTKLYHLFENSGSGLEITTSTVSHQQMISSHVTNELRILTTSPTPPYNVSILGEKNKSEYVDKCKHYDDNGWNNVVYCIEQWPFGENSFDPTSRVYYTAFTFFIQLTIPFLTITFCYFSIYLRLKKHTVRRNKRLDFYNEERLRRENNRAKRRNKQMVAISLVYLVAWLPLGTINILLDTFPDILGTNSAHIAGVFICCHILGMCSTSINPIIYGYSNKHIRKGILRRLCIRYLSYL